MILLSTHIKQGLWFVSPYCGKKEFRSFGGKNRNDQMIKKVSCLGICQLINDIDDWQVPERCFLKLACFLTVGLMNI